MLNKILIENEFIDHEHFCGVVVKLVFETHNLLNQLDNIDEIWGVGQTIIVTCGDDEYLINLDTVHDTDLWVHVEYELMWFNTETKKYETI